MIRAALVLAFLLCSSPSLAARFDKQRVTDDVRWRLHQDERRPLAVEALTSMLTLAARFLREVGRGDDADSLLGEWEGHYRAVVAGVEPEDVGDHLPFSVWLAEWYAALEAEFGIDYMEWSHLRDLWVLNFTLGPVFSADAGEAWCVEHMQDYPASTCRREYARHFVGTFYDEPGVDPYNTAQKHHGFSGVVAFWSAQIACSAMTSGTGAFIICGPAAMLIELTVEIFIAPEVSDAIWDRNNTF